MEIPVVIFKDKGSVYGVNVPDIKGVHSWGDTVEDALHNVKIAIIGHIEALSELGEPIEITQSAIETLQKNPDHHGGIWALVNLDLDKLDTTPERICIGLARPAADSIG